MTVVLLDAITGRPLFIVPTSGTVWSVRLLNLTPDYAAPNSTVHPALKLVFGGELAQIGTSTHLYTRTYAHSSICTHLYVRTYMHAPMHMHPYTCTHAHAPIDMHPYACTYTHAPMHMHPCICTHTHAPTHMHLYSQVSSRRLSSSTWPAG